MKDTAKKALLDNETFFLETANETSDLLKPKAGANRYELRKEGNPALGNRGMKKNLNPDKAIFTWDLIALRRLKNEPEVQRLLKQSSGKIGLVLRTVREAEELEATKTILRSLGIYEGDISLAIAVDVADMQYYFDDLLEGNSYGIKAIVMSPQAKRQCAQFKRGTEWNNSNTRDWSKAFNY